MEAAAFGSEVSGHGGCRDLRVVRISILQILVSWIVGNGKKEIDNVIFGGVTEVAVVTADCVFRLHLVEHGV